MDSNMELSAKRAPSSPCQSSQGVYQSNGNEIGAETEHHTFHKLPVLFLDISPKETVPTFNRKLYKLTALLLIIAHK